MKKGVVVLCVIVFSVVCLVSISHSAGRWERGVKLIGNYFRDPYGRTVNWKVGSEINLNRTDAFSTWSNKIKLDYGKQLPLNSTLEIVSPNNGQLATHYRRSITAFTNWIFYLSGGARLDNPDSLLVQSEVTVGKDFSRYLNGNIGVVDFYNKYGSDFWLKSYIIYHKPFGYRTLVNFRFEFNKEAKSNDHYKVLTEITLSYKMAKRLSLKIWSVTARDSNNASELYRLETIDLVYDLLYSGGSSY